MTDNDLTWTATDATLTQLTAGLLDTWLRIRGPNDGTLVAQMPGLAKTIYGALRDMTGATAPTSAVVPATPLIPAVPIDRSVTDDYLISLEDGKRYKTLKRHLSTRGMTFEQYKAKWGLPNDYPATAPSYSARRSELARANGLGQTRGPRSKK